MSFRKYIEKYVAGVVDAYSNFPVDDTDKVIHALLRAYYSDKVVFAMGSGGSGNLAAHLLQDLAKHTIVSDSKNEIAVDKRFKTLCLNECVSVLTTWANDMGYDEVFSQQLENWVEKGDVVFGISGSGNSKNIVNALNVANSKGATTIALTGHQGGEIAKLADIAVIVPSDVNYYIEDVHSSLVHIWTDIVRSYIQGKFVED